MIQALFISVEQSGVLRMVDWAGWVGFLGSAGQTVRRVTLWARVAAWQTGMALALAFGFGFGWGLRLVMALWCDDNDGT